MDECWFGFRSSWGKEAEVVDLDAFPDNADERMIRMQKLMAMLQHKDPGVHLYSSDVGDPEYGEEEGEDGSAKAPPEIDDS